MKKLAPPHIEQFGERAILMHWEASISNAVLYAILSIKEQLKKKLKMDNPEIINTYNSLLIKYPKKIRDFDKEREELLQFLSIPREENALKVRVFTLPVCYHTDFGLDLEAVARQKGYTVEEIVQKHTAPTYTLFFQGFLPGFLYLGGLDSDLAIPRKKEPRLKVRQGAVGLAEHQTGVYPQESAGGWQIIGNCPVNLLDPEKDPPSPFCPGDQLKFTEVSLPEYKTIKKEVQAGKYEIETQSYQL